MQCYFVLQHIYRHTVNKVMYIHVLSMLIQDAATKREALMNRKVMKKLDKLEQISVSGRT